MIIPAAQVAVGAIAVKRSLKRRGTKLARVAMLGGGALLIVSGAKAFGVGAGTGGAIRLPSQGNPYGVTP